MTLPTLIQEELEKFDKECTELVEDRGNGIKIVRAPDPKVRDFLTSSLTRISHATLKAVELDLDDIIGTAVKNSYGFNQTSTRTWWEVDLDKTKAELREKQAELGKGFIGGMVKDCERCGKNHYDPSRTSVPSCPFKPFRTGGGTLD